MTHYQYLIDVERSNWRIAISISLFDGSTGSARVRTADVDGARATGEGVRGLDGCRAQLRELYSENRGAKPRSLRSVPAAPSAEAETSVGVRNDRSRGTAGHFLADSGDSDRSPVESIIWGGLLEQAGCSWY